MSRFKVYRWRARSSRAGGFPRGAQLSSRLARARLGWRRKAEHDKARGESPLNSPVRLRINQTSDVASTRPELKNVTTPPRVLRAADSMTAYPARVWLDHFPARV